MTVALTVMQYNMDAALKAQHIMGLMFDPKMYSKLIVDITDPKRLANANPQTAIKSAQTMKQQLCEFSEACPEFIGKVQLYSEREIRKYIKIIENFEAKIIDLTNQINATLTSIIDMLISGLIMTLQLSINLLLQILHFTLIDVFWTVFSMSLKAVWMEYANTLMSGSFGFWPSPATGAMVIALAAVQLSIEAEYLAYLFAKIAQYVIGTTIAILLVLLFYVSWIANYTIQVVMLSERLFEQVIGLAGTIPCIPIILEAQAYAIEQLQVRALGALACIK